MRSDTWATVIIAALAIALALGVLWYMGTTGAEQRVQDSRTRCPSGYVLINADHYGYSRVCVPGVEPE